MPYFRLKPNAGLEVCVPNIFHLFSLIFFYIYKTKSGYPGGSYEL